MDSAEVTRQLDKLDTPSLHVVASLSGAPMWMLGWGGNGAASVYVTVKAYEYLFDNLDAFTADDDTGGLDLFELEELVRTIIDGRGEKTVWPD